MARKRIEWDDPFDPFDFLRGQQGFYARPSFRNDPLYLHICAEAIEYFVELWKMPPKLLEAQEYRAGQLRPDMKERMFGFMQQRLTYWGKEGFILPPEKKKDE